MARTLLFEIGTEELPAFDLHDAVKQLPGSVEKQFAAANIRHGEVDVFSTPRRIAVRVKDVPEQTAAFKEEFRGPAVRIAFDENGEPTKAAAGFARGKGLTVDQLERREEGGTEYVFAVREVQARDVASLLPGILGSIITGIYWPKTQRWGSRSEQFSRPVRWLVALFGDETVPVEFAGLTAGDETRGHRFLSPGPHRVPTADDYTAVLKANYVMPMAACREKSIREQIAALEEQQGLRCEIDGKTMAEVVNLTEWPTVMVGSFDELFLAVPKEITVDAMLVHQRYFPLFNADGSLANKFVITSNGDPAYEANIVDGNQRVVAARLYDAKFFYDEDLKQPLENFVDRLDEVVFQESLGTMRAKAQRICSLAGTLAEQAGVSAEELADAKRAAYLAKADLVTNAVVEFTSVQGIMGRYYALAAGEGERVAQAIADHYRPKFAGDDLPESTVGRIVAMADKIDAICGLFAVGQAPTGSSDPFALRRSAIGTIAMLEAGLPVSLVGAVDASLDTYDADGLGYDRAATREQVLDFFVTRTKVICKDKGASPDAIDAVLAAGVQEPAVILARVAALEAARKDDPDTFEDLATAYARANNLREAQVGAAFDESLFNEVEHALSCAVTQAESKVVAALAADDYPAALAALAALRAPIDLFFEKIMVKDEDAKLRANRMKLLNAFVAVFANVADFGKMAKAK